MESLRTYLVVWLSGVVAGVVLMERWRRTSGLQVPAAENVGVAVEPDAAITAMKVSARQPSVSAVIVAGAKADAERARHFLVRMTPGWRSSAPSLAQLRRSGQSRMPATTPDNPA
jgi:hypothetical protein